MSVYTKKIYEQVRELIVQDAQGKSPGEEIDSEVGYAKRFGVSRPTVRKAVEELIAIGMIKRIAGKGLVLAAADEIPNRGKLLLVLPHFIGDGFMYRVLMGCVDQANHLGFDYKIINTFDEATRLQLVNRERLSDYVAAVTCCYGTPEEMEILGLLQARGLPTLLMDNPIPESDLPCVTCDDEQGGYLMGSYLARKGHKRIVNLSSLRPALTIQKRDEGFFRALRDYNVDYDPQLYIRQNSQSDLFQQRFTPQDIRDGKITAICSHSSLFISRISRWLYQNGLRIRDDISIMGYGDHPFLVEYGMPFTSIEVPSEDMGRSAINEISEALLEKRTCRDVMLGVWLEKRHTVKTLEP